MKKLMTITLISLCAFSTNIFAKDKSPLIYVNKHIGFNVADYKYDQPEFPCKIDANLVDSLVTQSKKSNIEMVSVETAEKIRNGKVPVVLIDIEKLVLGEEHKYGEKTNSNLPKIQITAGLLKGKDLQTAKHTCAIAMHSNHPLMSTEVVTYSRPPVAKCEAVNKCLIDISKDVVEWLQPQLK